jgi:hypothetical protein
MGPWCASLNEIVARIKRGVNPPIIARSEAKMSQDTGLVKRGFVLLAAMSVLVIVVLIIIFQRTVPAMPLSGERPELLSACLIRTGTAFPVAVAWLDIYKIGEAFPSAEGWKIRYNAAGALARRGSADTPWEILLEMLDENRQLRNFRVELQDGKVAADEAAARLTMVYALRAIADWHKKQQDRPKEVAPELAKVYAAVDKLASNPVMEIKTQVENTRKVFFR